MRYRKLRIAWSVVWGVVAVLLVVLWVRSYWRTDTCAFPIGVSVQIISSSRGELGIGSLTSPSPPGTFPWNVTSDKADGKRLWAGMKDSPPLSWFGIRYQQFSPAMTLFAVTYWLPVLITVIFAYAPWIRQHRWRFTLRTLLIATTLAAIFLGLIVYLSR
jgi:hypothetical protein